MSSWLSRAAPIGANDPMVLRPAHPTLKPPTRRTHGRQIHNADPDGQCKIPLPQNTQNTPAAPAAGITADNLAGKITAFGTAALTLAAVGEYAHQKIAGIGSTAASAVATASNTTAELAGNLTSTASNIAEKTTSVGSGIIDSASGVVGDVKTVVSWGWWAFRLLPSTAQATIGLSVALAGIYLWRSRGSGSVHNNLNIHLNLPQGPACRTITRKQGDDLFITHDCTPHKIANPAHYQDYFKVRRLHKHLQKMHADHATKLKSDLKEKVLKMLSELDTAAANKYQDVDLLDLSKRVSNLDFQVSKAYTLSIVEKMKPTKAV